MADAWLTCIDLLNGFSAVHESFALAKDIDALVDYYQTTYNPSAQAPKQELLDMTALPVARGPDGRILPGHSGNPSGRPVGSISEFRRRFEPHMGEVAETLLALLRSPNESTRLSACREILDRTLGRSAIAIDATHTKFDVGQLYLAIKAGQRRSRWR
jgi:hypothetical protein